MNTYSNPFEHEAAAGISADRILDFFVEDYNFSRFINSTKNIFVFGERGSGKSMTLLYNSFPLNIRKAQRSKNLVPYEKLGIYIPCLNPIHQRCEFELLVNDYHKQLLTEHFSILSILYHTAETLSEDAKLREEIEDPSIVDELNFVLGFALPENKNPFDAIIQFAQKEIISIQRTMNRDNPDFLDHFFFSFSSIVYPFIKILRKLPTLSNSHFMFMFDDADSLNIIQRRVLSSWVSFRDQSIFSIKIAAAKSLEWDFLTIGGGTIVEGHDFIVLDMEQPFQAPKSQFGKLAQNIIKRRLELSNIDVSPDDFFPVHPNFDKGLKAAMEEVKLEAKKKYPDGSSKQISDFVQRYGRAKYFKGLPSKANRPLYSGFQIIVDLSTGVIRNLLDPCFYMFDTEFSNVKEVENGRVEFIPPKVQRGIILSKSERLWEIIRDGLDKSVVGCSHEQARKVDNFFTCLATLFRKRLLEHKSEPRVLAFTISGMDDELENTIIPILDIARRGHLLYVRSGVSKEKGQREDYFVPNRMLWPAIGLDPHGQHGRASIKALDILSAMEGKDFPFPDSKEYKYDLKQENLFDEEPLFND